MVFDIQAGDCPAQPQGYAGFGEGMRWKVVLSTGTSTMVITVPKARPAMMVIDMETQKAS